MTKKMDANPPPTEIEESKQMRDELRVESRESFKEFE